MPRLEGNSIPRGMTSAMPCVANARGGMRPFGNEQPYWKGAIFMAIGTHGLQTWGINETAHPVLFKAFAPDECQRLIEEDLFAGRTVSIELAAVAAFGLLIGAIAVLFTL
jgi:hypothetical protein